ncbi:hypothetical protein JCM11641_007771 [Rhodosporidiobolus odoratus]
MVATTLEGPLVANVGSTGTQGGSVVDHLIRSDKPYRLRGLTRNASKPKSQELKGKGCEVVEADVSKREDLDKAFAGADIFLYVPTFPAFIAVTDFWQHMSIEREIAGGKRLVNAAKAAGTVKLLIWSGLESVKKITDGKYSNVDHFDGKAQVTNYTRVSGIPSSVVQALLYMSNFHLAMGLPSKNENGKAVFAFPLSGDAKMPFIDTPKDHGAFVRAAIEQLEPGTEVLACSEQKNMSQIAAEWTEVTSIKAIFQQVSREDFLAPFSRKHGLEGLES